MKYSTASVPFPFGTKSVMNSMSVPFWLPHVNTPTYGLSLAVTLCQRIEDSHVTSGIKIWQQVLSICIRYSQSQKACMHFHTGQSVNWFLIVCFKRKSNFTVYWKEKREKKGVIGVLILRHYFVVKAVFLQLSPLELRVFDRFRKL